jgi:hypothetical protein
MNKDIDYRMVHLRNTDRLCEASYSATGTGGDDGDWVARGGGRSCGGSKSGTYNRRERSSLVG